MEDEKVNILLVDDQDAKLLSYEVMLAELGENLIKARSAQEALAHLLKNEIALVLIDVCMPDLDGFELAAMIRGHPRFERTAIIFVSAIQISDIDRLKGYQHGAVDYVPVPVVPDLLRAKVKVVAELYRKTRELERLNSELEVRVAQRTFELERANAELERRVEERTREREVALAQVHEMQKLESLGQLTGGIAHDFNNLLTIVLGNLELIRHRLPEDDRSRRLLDMAIMGAERGTNLTRRMLAFARRQELKPEAVDIAGIEDGILDMLRRSLGPTIEITTEFEEGLPPVNVDPNQLEHALLNLALNARDAMPDGGPLRVTARIVGVAGDNGLGLQPADYCCLAVIDSGSGMDESTLKRATEPFFTTKGVGKGTGLGLSIVHGFALQSGGAMRIESTPGAGCTVELWLPLAERRSADPVRGGRAAAMASRRRRILLVDDDPLVLTTTAAILDDIGHEVKETSSAAEALAWLSEGNQVDLVITDDAMPVMTGTALARHVRETWTGLPVLIVTGYAERAGEIGDVPRLIKPVMQEQLAATVEAMTTASNIVPLKTPRRLRNSALS